MNKTKQIKLLKLFFTGPRILNGGDLLEYWLICSNDECGGQGFYDGTLEKCAKHAYEEGYRIINEKVYCKECQ